MWDLVAKICLRQCFASCISQSVVGLSNNVAMEALSNLVQNPVLDPVEESASGVDGNPAKLVEFEVVDTGDAGGSLAGQRDLSVDRVGIDGDVHFGRCGADAVDLELAAAEVGVEGFQTQADSQDDFVTFSAHGGITSPFDGGERAEFAIVTVEVAADLDEVMPLLVPVLADVRNHQLVLPLLTNHLLKRRDQLVSQLIQVDCVSSRHAHQRYQKQSFENHFVHSKY
uniref:Mediator of DNA damage checkpoint protein 1 n=1 Tax=Lygus hesperus TaxID=30085 RepID=A0A0A9Z7J2_LYGHE